MKHRRLLILIALIAGLGLYAFSRYSQRQPSFIDALFNPTVKTPWVGGLSLEELRGAPPFVATVNDKVVNKDVARIGKSSPLGSRTVLRSMLLLKKSDGESLVVFEETYDMDKTPFASSLVKGKQYRFPEVVNAWLATNELNTISNTSGTGPGSVREK